MSLCVPALLSLTQLSFVGRCFIMCVVLLGGWLVDVQAMSLLVDDGVISSVGI